MTCETTNNMSNYMEPYISACQTLNNGIRVTKRSVNRRTGCVTEEGIKDTERYARGGITRDICWYRQEKRSKLIYGTHLAVMTSNIGKPAREAVINIPISRGVATKFRLGEQILIEGDGFR